MRKFFRKHGRFLQGLYIILFFAALIVLGCSKEKSPYEDINHYKDATVLKIEHDTIDNTYKFYIKDRSGSYRDFLVDPEWGDIFEKGDIL